MEEVYRKKTPLEHILLRPDTYVGSVEKHTQTLWVYEQGAMVLKSVNYSPGLYEIFDDILLNAADNMQRDPSMDSLRVDIDVEGCCISVYNNGNGVPVEIHQGEGVYVPEMIFGHLLTSSNYDDNERKTTGGRNGYGAKLANIFSTEFVIETADGRRQKKYKQVFSENMGKKSEPQIEECQPSENWTRVTFKPDLAKFNMTELEDDVVALMRKRVVDMAGTLGKTVKVELNGKELSAKSFSDYVQMYIDSACKVGFKLPRIYEKVNDRWEVCVTLSEGQFQQVSFVNGIATIRGGTHVDYVANQIANHVMDVVNKRNKHGDMKFDTVKSYLWVFVNALIDNPAFDSHTKDILTTRQESFGSNCELSEDFLKRVSDSGVVSNLLSSAEFKLSKELKYTDGSKRTSLLDIPELEDANEAGRSRSKKCTLILTEGDSAKALAMAGIGIVGRDHYGVFPLRGKLLNVREASDEQIMENAVIQKIKKIIGLQHGKNYDSTEGLRYDQVMLMTNQDHDGSYMKGLMMNFIHFFWPSLLKVPGFLVDFVTPIIKATNSSSNSVKSFYSMPDYEAWKEKLGKNASLWSIKYYKGLGTSTSQEAREYFEDIGRHKKDFVWADDKDGECIELAFSKEKSAERKEWLTNYQPGSCLDQRKKHIKYSDFIDKKLILFWMADLERSIPSMVDGLKSGQRKILFCSFKRNLGEEAMVAQFIGYVSEHSAYHHGHKSLASIIIGMAQDFVGSNNISLLEPLGLFGTRNAGGRDAGSARDFYTRLPLVTRLIFPKDDDILLNYLNEDGQSIEPSWYMPIIPMVLVNGSEGIGAGWSSHVPNYNPRDIIANLKRLLNKETVVPMSPWYKGFKGCLKETSSNETGVTYTISGVIEEVDDTKLKITELPVGCWTADYEQFLKSMCPHKEKGKGKDKNKDKAPPFLEKYRSRCNHADVDFEVILSEENMNIAKQEGLEKKFKLTTVTGTTNMHLLDSHGKLRKYDTPEDVLEEFFILRFEFYVRRKAVMVENIRKELLKLKYKVRFIDAVISRDIIVINRKRIELLLELKRKEYDDPFPNKKFTADPFADVPVEAAAGVNASDYDYLFAALSTEKVQDLVVQQRKLEDEVKSLLNTSPEILWLRDLDALEKELDVLDAKFEAKEEKRRCEHLILFSEDARASKAAPKIQPKKAAAESCEANLFGSNQENVAPIPKPAAQKKKPPKKASAPVRDDEAAPAMRDCLAAYNLDSSPEPDRGHALEAETTEEQLEGRKRKNEANKRDATKKAMSSLTKQKSFLNKTMEIQKKIGGRKRVTDKLKTAIKKEAPAQSEGMMHEVMEEIYRLTDDSNSSASPKKKARKIKDFPFSKKIGSISKRTSPSKEKEIPKLTDDSNSSASPKKKVRKIRDFCLTRRSTRGVASPSTEA